MSAQPIVEALGISTRFGENWIHRRLDFSVLRGEAVALVGGSGSGKTTLLRQLIGLQAPQEGQVRLFGQALACQGDGAALRRRFGVLFQHGALFSAFSVFDNIAFPLRELRRLPARLIHDLVLLKMALVGLEPRHAYLMPAELSGGMVKRVALARALALDPELLLLDEPTAGLDPDRSAAFVRLIVQLRRELGLTVVFITHDLDTLKTMASRVAVLADQRILVSGGLESVVAYPHPFIRQFFASHLEHSAVAQRR